MKKILFLIIIIFFLFVSFSVFAQTQNQTKNPQVTERFSSCDQCGFCPPNPPPQSWQNCKKCLYPEASDDPSSMDTLRINPETNTPPTPQPGKQYTFFGCLGGGSSFTQESGVGSVVQSLLNVIFGISGGIAFLYLIYGAFVIATSQADPERLNYGKRAVSGAIIGLVFVLGSVFLVNFIASGILKIPNFGQ